MLGGNGWNFVQQILHPVISELCRRPADLDKHDQECCDCWTRREHLGFQLRIQRKCFLPSANASRVEICKIRGSEQSIAWKAFNF